MRQPRTPEATSRRAAAVPNLALGVQTVAVLAVLVLGVAGCGQDAEPPAPCDPCGPSVEAVDHQVVDVLTVTAAGGAVSTTPTPLPDSPSLLRYAASLRSADPSGAAGDALADAVTSTVRGHPPAAGNVLAAAVVRVGCGTPEEVTVEQVAGRLEVSAEPEPSGVACEVPETSVAVIEVPAELLPTDPGPTRSIEPPDPD